MNQLWKEKIEEEAEIIRIDGKQYIHCPVCGKLVGLYDICFKCGWQNTGETNIDGGPNEMTLAEAKRAYANSEVINKHLFGENSKIEK